MVYVNKLTNLKNRRGFDLKIAEIEKNIEEYDNALLIYRFSVAIGCSFLKGKDGVMKKIALWKEEADYKMYENKKEKKFKENGI